MAPRTQYDAADVHTEANEAAEKEIHILAQAGVRLLPSAEVICEYLGVQKHDGFALDARPTFHGTQPWAPPRKDALGPQGGHK